MKPWVRHGRSRPSSCASRNHLKKGGSQVPSSNVWESFGKVWYIVVHKKLCKTPPSNLSFPLKMGKEMRCETPEICSHPSA